MLMPETKKEARGGKMQLESLPPEDRLPFGALVGLAVARRGGPRREGEACPVSNLHDSI